MTYAKLTLQHIKNQYQLMFTLSVPKKEIAFKPLDDENLVDTLVVSFGEN